MVLSSVCALFFLDRSGGNRMSVDPTNARELAEIASEIGADVLLGHAQQTSHCPAGQASRTTL